MKSRLLVTLFLLLLYVGSFLVTLSTETTTRNGDGLGWAMADTSSTASASSFWLMMTPPIQSAIRRAQ